MSISGSGIYTITNLVNNKIYVGKSVDYQRRLWDHKYELRKNIHNNRYLQRSFNKYGENSFEFELLEECEEQYLCSQENYWCNMLNTHCSDYGYNMRGTDPFSGTGKMLEETKKKIGLGNKGKIRTEEMKQIYREKQTGKKASLQAIENMKLSHIKHGFSVLQFDLNGVLIKRFNNIDAASKETNVSYSLIRSHCMRIVKKPKNLKFIWKFEKDIQDNVIKIS